MLGTQGEGGDNSLLQECFDFYQRHDQMRDHSLLELEDLESNNYPLQYSEEYKIERCQTSSIQEEERECPIEEEEEEVEEILENVEERTEESSSRNQTPSAINPMEVSNYQDELNNFIISRTGGNQGIQLHSGLTSANDSNSQVQKGSSMINTNRFQYVVNKFENGGDTPNGAGFIMSNKKTQKQEEFFGGSKDDDEEAAFLYDSLNSQAKTPDGVKCVTHNKGELLSGSDLPLQAECYQQKTASTGMMSSDMTNEALHQAELSIA